MRNILVFPDGSEHQFMYPTNRTIEVGEQLQVDMEDGNTHLLKVLEIQKTDLEVYYHLGF
jgi:hypothetical protein